MIPSIEPVLNPLWVWLLVGEVPVAGRSWEGR